MPRRRGRKKEKKSFFAEESNVPYKLYQLLHRDFRPAMQEMGDKRKGIIE